MKYEGKSEKEKINLRIDTQRLLVIDKAVEIAGKSRTEFMTDAAYQKAEEVLLDRKIFFLDQVDIDYINNSNPDPDPIVKEILKRKSRWDA